MKYDDKSPDPFIIGYRGYWYGYVGRSWDDINDADGRRKEFATEQELRDYAEVNNIELYHLPSFSEKDKYIVAKFGDHDREWEELKEMAVDRLIEKYGSELKRDISRKQEALKNIKENALLYLNAEILESEVRGDR